MGQSHKKFRKVSINNFLNKIILGDCLEVMKNIPDNSVDMVLCDLPYGITARNKWDSIIPLDKLWEHYKRIAKENTAFIFTSAQPFTTKLIMSNKKMFRYDLIWKKTLPVGFFNANKMPLRLHEEIIIFYKKLPKYNPQKTKGKPYKVRRKSIGTNYNDAKVERHITENKTGDRFPVSVVEFPLDKIKQHPTQKPVELFKYLIKTYTNESGVVLDNCIGFGTTAIACLETGRQFIGIEKDEKYFEMAVKRIEGWGK